MHQNRYNQPVRLSETLTPETLFAGGELYEDPFFSVAEPALPCRGWHFLAGGQCCLRVIARDLIRRGVLRLLLPAYICPDVLTVLQQEGVDVGFYAVNQNFFPDLKQIADGLNQPVQTALYLVHYFGFPCPLSAQNFFYRLKQQGILLIEDNAQAGFLPERLGSYVFNSMRKLVPYDGGYLYAETPLQDLIPDLTQDAAPRLKKIRAYRRGLTEYLFRGADTYDQLVELYEQSEQEYLSASVSAGNVLEKTAIEHQNWEAIRQIRRRNYLYLLKALRSFTQLKIIFPVLPPSVMPMGFPVYSITDDRDGLLERLAEAGIGLTVHWEAVPDHPILNQNAVAVDMARHIFTLPVDQLTTQAQLDYLCLQLKQAGVQ